MASDNETREQFYQNMSEYGRVLNLQNNGIPCPYCHSSLGHYQTCPLLTGGRKFAESLPELATVPDKIDQASENVFDTESAKAYQYLTDSALEISEGDKIGLRGLGVIW
jgi:hypothetical protein